MEIRVEVGVKVGVEVRAEVVVYKGVRIGAEGIGAEGIGAHGIGAQGTGAQGIGAQGNKQSEGVTGLVLTWAAACKGAVVSGVT